MINENRKNERIKYCATIKCSKIISEGEVSVFNPPLEVKVENIAPEGLCIHSFESFREGSILEFDIILDNILYEAITATIIWKTTKKDTYDYGLHIQNITGRFGIHIIEIGRRVFRNV